MFKLRKCLTFLSLNNTAFQPHYVLFVSVYVFCVTQNINHVFTLQRLNM